MTLKKSLITAVTLSYALLPSTTFAQHTTDLYFQQSIERYFDTPGNARTFGMAGSSTQTSTDSSSTVANPAGLGFMSGGELSASYGRNNISGNEFPTGASINQHTNSASTFLALPIGPGEHGLPDYGNFGIAWNGADSKWERDTFGTESNRTQVTAAYAAALSKEISIGYSLGWLDDHLQSEAISNYPMGDGIRHTVGVVWKFGPEITVGSSLYIGSGTHHVLYGPGISEDSRTTQQGLDVGVTYNVDGVVYSIGADYRHLGSNGDVESSIPENVVGGDENGKVFDVRLGLEAPLNNWSVVRAGYRYAGFTSYRYNRTELNELNGSANYNAFTLGYGVVLPVSSEYITSVNLDYGVEYRAIGDNDWQHLITASVPFNLCG